LLNEPLAPLTLSTENRKALEEPLCRLSVLVITAVLLVMIVCREAVAEAVVDPEIGWPVTLSVYVAVA
jgi:hypothetical protein